MAEDNTTPEDDDLPILTDEDQTETDQTAAGEDEDDAGDQDGDTYDIRDELDDNDKHVLGLLTDEEIAALAEDEGGEDEPDPEEDADDAGQADASAAPDDQVQDAAKPDPEPQAQPAQVELTEDEITQINEAAKAARKEAMDKWRDGDLTDDELQEQMDAAERAREEARQQIIADRQQQAEDEAFEQRQAAFHEVARDYLTKDYPDLATPAHLAEFDRHVRSVTVSPRFAGKTPREMLEAAHRLYIAEAEVLGIEAPPLKGAAKSAAPAPKAEPKPAPKPAARKKPEIVPTLARVPAAATNSAADGKWGALQAKFDACGSDVRAQEKLLSTLSEEEMEAFASMDLDG
jgi:hypothetical protein